MRQQSSLARLLASAAVTAILAAGLGGCQTMSDITGSLTLEGRAGRKRRCRSAPRRRGLWRALPRQSQGCRRRAGLWPGAARHRAARPGGRRARTGHHRPSRQQGAARRLTAGRWPTTAISSRRSTCSAAPIRPTIPTGEFCRCREPRWIKLGRHDEARRYYASALKIVPEEPSVLSNLGLSYVLSKDLPKAEEVLRRAYASAAGRRAGAAESRRWWSACRAASPKPRPSSRPICRPDEAAANVAYLKADAEPQGQSARRHRIDPGGRRLDRRSNWTELDPKRDLSGIDGCMIVAAGGLACDRRYASFTASPRP